MATAHLEDKAAVAVACAEQVLVGARVDQRDRQAEPIVELQHPACLSSWPALTLKARFYR